MSSFIERQSDSEAKRNSILIHWPTFYVSLSGTGAVRFTFCIAIVFFFFGVFFFGGGVYYQMYLNFTWRHGHVFSQN